MVIDEIGSWFTEIQDQSSNVSQIPATLSKLWGQKPNGRYGLIRRANRTEKEEQTEIQWPTFALAGASVSESFWDACGDDHISGGFLNRCTVLDAGVGSLDWVEQPPNNPDKLPEWMTKCIRIGTRNRGPDQRAYPMLTDDWAGPSRIGWDPQVKEACRDHALAFRRMPPGKKRTLSVRTVEMAVRLATTAALWSGMRNVGLNHFEWGWEWAELSRDTVLTAANETMKVKRDFGAICRHIAGLVADGPMRRTDIHTKCRSAGGQYGMKIVDDALEELVSCGELLEIKKDEAINRGLRGPQGVDGSWYELVGRRKY
jgi:hypothetical protein